MEHFDNVKVFVSEHLNSVPAILLRHKVLRLSSYIWFSPLVYRYMEGLDQICMVIRSFKKIQ